MCIRDRVNSSTRTWPAATFTTSPPTPRTASPPRAEKLILFLYYYEEMTMKEIGETLDLSESRVSQMHSYIIDRRKAQLNSRKKEFVLNAL